ncbi:MAG TPA: PP2C family serine/threonine-protein phosphatase [Vicinamibacterales bacterium]
MRLQVGARTDTGRVRTLNEDVFLLRPEQGLFLVCDGMGGCPAGEVASEMAALSILKHVSRRQKQPATAAGQDDQYLPQSRWLRRAVERSNQYIYEQAQAEPDRAGMGSTVVGAWISGAIVSVAHVGDSRAYLWHRNRLARLTRDHSLTEDGAHRNVLLRVLGREATVAVDVRELAVQPDDYLLLCSDGLTNAVPEAAMSSAIARLRDPQRICDELVDMANRHGGPDNITVVVVAVIGSLWQSVWDWTRRLSGGHIAAADSAS